MRRTAFATIIVLAASAAWIYTLQAEGAPKVDAPTDLRKFFEGMVQDYGKSSLPTSDEIGKMSDRIDTGPPQEVSDALPAILTAVRHRDATVRIIGAAALLGVSVRPDRFELLSKYLLPLSGLISSDDPRAVGFVVMTLANAWPNPPPEVLPRLLDYLKRRDVDPRVQADVLRYVVRGAAEKPEAMAAVMEFWSRPLDKGARIAALLGLQNSHSKDPRIIDLVISSLDDRDFDIQMTAFSAIRIMGPAAMQQARLPMQKVAREYVALVERKDADPNVQVSAIEELLSYEPNDPEVVNAVVEFYSRPLDFGPRTSVQDALRTLRTPHLQNVRLIDLVIGSLQDPDPQVRSNAAYVLKDMGPRALVRARPALERLAQDPNQPAEVKEGAKRALMEMGKIR